MCQESLPSSYTTPAYLPGENTHSCPLYLHFSHTDIAQAPWRSAEMHSLEWKWSFIMIYSLMKTLWRSRLLHDWPPKWDSGIIHPKMIILSSFTHLHVFPSQYDFFSSVKHKKEKFWRMFRLLLSLQWTSEWNVGLLHLDLNKISSSDLIWKYFFKQMYL